MDHILFGPMIGGICLSIFALLAKDYPGFLKLLLITLILTAFWFYLGGKKRIKVFFKVRGIMKQFPKNSDQIGMNEVAELLQMEPEYLQNLNFSFTGPNIQPKAYVRDISLKNRSSLTRTELKQLAYFKFSEIDMVQNRSDRYDYIGR